MEKKACRQEMSLELDYRFTFITLQDFLQSWQSLHPRYADLESEKIIKSSPQARCVLPQNQSQLNWARGAGSGHEGFLLRAHGFTSRQFFVNPAQCRHAGCFEKSPVTHTYLSHIGGLGTSSLQIQVISSIMQ